MADFSQSLSNSFLVIDGAPTIWGTAVWGTDSWGYTTPNYVAEIGKYLTNSVTPDGATQYMNATHKIENDITSTHDLSNATQMDSEGYFTNFTYPSTNRHTAQRTIWTEVTND